MAADDDAVLLVFSTLPDAAAARRLADRLLAGRLAACISVLAPCTSVYRWQGRVETATEVPVMIKTAVANYAALEAAIRADHPYELPEIIAVPVQRGLPGYLDWIVAQTAPAPIPPAPSPPSP